MSSGDSDVSVDSKRLLARRYSDGEVAEAFTELDRVLALFKHGALSEGHVVSAINVLIEANVRKAAAELRREMDRAYGGRL